MLGPQLCSNAHCKRTSPGDGPTCRWHVRNYGTKDEAKHITLCNACKINFDQRKYCPFCGQIYREKDPDSFDGKEWVGCDNSKCRRWVHVGCEVAVGNKVDSAAYYLCPSCQQKAHESRDRKRADRSSAQGHVRENIPSSDSTTVEVKEKQEMPPSEPNSRRPLQVDLSKLDTSSLKRYWRVYNLGDPTSSRKEDLLPAVARHFAGHVVDEKEKLLSFANFLKK